MTNTEPQGIKDLREAKADYLASLSKLREADAELVKAEAAYKDAETAYKNAETALKQALVKAEEIKNSRADAEAKAYIDSIVAQAKITAVNQEKELAKAEAALEETLRNIAVTSQSLTDKEKAAVDSFTVAYANYIEVLNEVRIAERTAYDKAEDREAFILEQKEDSARALAAIAYYKELIQNLPDSGQSEAEREAFYEKLKNDELALDYKVANLQKEWNLYEQTEVDPQIKGFAEELGQWVAQNAALPAPFMMHYKAELPDNKQVVKLLDTYVKHFKVRGISVLADDGVLTANFNSSVDAEDGISALADIIDGLGRDLVIDSTKGKRDTLGMAAAVSAAKKEYTEIVNALSKGVMAYPKVTESISAYKAAIEDSTAKKEALDAAIDSLKSKWDALRGVYNLTEEGTVELSELLARPYYTAFQDAVLDFAKARKAYFGPAATTKDVLSTGKGVCGLDSIMVWDSRTIGGDDVFKAKAIADLKADDFLPIEVEDDQYITVFDVETNYGTSLQARMEAYNVLLRTLTPNVNHYGDWYARRDSYSFITDGFLKFLFSAPVVDDEGNVTYDAYQYVVTDASKKESDYYEYDYAHESISDEVTFTPANLDGKHAAMIDAKKGYYKNVYWKYWFSDKVFDATLFKQTEDNFSFDNAKQDSIHLDITYDTFTKESLTVNFDTEAVTYLPDKKKGTFKLGPGFVKEESLQTNQFNIAWKEFLGKNETAAADLQFDQTLLAKLLCEEKIYNGDLSGGSEGVSAALAALEDICLDMVSECAAAIKAQSDNSKPFYTFIEGLVGKDCLDHIFAALDSALTAYAQYAPARAEGQNTIIDLANAIAAKDLTAKEALIAFFEKFMCAQSFDKNIFTLKLFEKPANSVQNQDELKKMLAEANEQEAQEAATEVVEEGQESQTEPTAKGVSYRDLYIALQVADAVPGEQIRVLLSDVLTAFVNSLKIDIVGWNKALAEKTDTDNIIEKILFGTVRAIYTFDPLNWKQNAVEEESGYKATTAFNRNIVRRPELGVSTKLVLGIIAPVLVPYILNDFGGELGALEEKYLSDWAEKWAEFDIQIAELEGEEEALKTAKAIYDTYFWSIKDVIKACERYEKEIEKAEEKYAKACDHLAKIEAGVSWKTIASEGAADALEAAKVKLEAAEAKLATAEAAYKQVLANHGLTE